MTRATSPTLERLRAKAIWIVNQRRPRSHPRDVALMKRVMPGTINRYFVWTERRVERKAVVGLGSVSLGDG
jgi:hypothetical protein